jgi:CRP-like cAMP-binding protein
MADLAEILTSIPLFSALSREEIAKVLGKLEKKVFSSGATIFSQGDAGDAFYLIESGNVQVVLQTPGAQPETVAVLGGLDWFGEMALLSGEPRSATIVAVKDTSAWRLTREDWFELIDKHPTWLLHFCATLSKRLSQLDRRYSESAKSLSPQSRNFTIPDRPRTSLLRRSRCSTGSMRIGLPRSLRSSRRKSFLPPSKKAMCPCCSV